MGDRASAQWVQKATFCGAPIQRARAMSMGALTDSVPSSNGGQASPCMDESVRSYHEATTFCNCHWWQEAISSPNKSNAKSFVACTI
jgi:hypothetical protein